MKRFLFAAVLAAAAAPALAADVVVSASIGQPGFYGRLDIGGYAPPQLIYQQPIIIERIPAYRQPIYLNVPPGHAKNWRKHCGAYGACGESVYFVQNSWYQREYVPQYHRRHDYRREENRDEYRDDYRGDYRRQGGEDRDEYRGKPKNDGHGKQGHQGKQGRGH
ncbi:MAG: hypothetical protein H6942_07270 [Candidatus Accumulibacter sp.]|uniref:hypothetical protein n=1 Tax=Accumulibacter sp. TaxID=2053492 RepID=UPI0019ED7362|nr:hypothetical protein [Accumulibacter sp.]MBE2257221.1 hypothetical protein [Paracoccaceae bacterium]MCB1940917.1 hypothetical protein [Accumulibacter sp.]MCP5248326.1 hypothetical protein [Accumulibacter sp.]